MQKPIAVTTLRANLYKLVDAVMDSGEPLVIHRKGKKLLLKLLDEKPSRNK